MESLIITILVVFIVIVSSFSYWQNRRLKNEAIEQAKETQRRMYELAIQKELGERIGYSFDVQKIIDIITGSLSQFIEYSAVSYMLVEPENIVFKVHLEKSVSRKFVNDIRDRMLKSLAALLDRQFKIKQVKETLSGAILVEEPEEPVSSFFNIPLVIGEKVVGVLTVAHILAGLYKEEEMTILYKITKQASNAVTSLQKVVETEQKKLNAMVESMSEGVVMTDKDYRIVVVNPAAKRAVGLDTNKEDLTIFDFIDNLDSKFDIKGRLEESVKLDKNLISEEVLIGDRFFQIYVSPVKSSLGMEENEILGGVIIFHDITHEKELEKMRQDFTSMMVHELRSPLDGIKKMSELIKGKKLTKSDEKYAEYTSLVYNDSSRMLELVKSLLDVAKLESGKIEIIKKPSSLKELINDRVKFYSSSAKDAKVILETQLAKDLPEQINFDPTKISQVLNNLISNSLKFTNMGGKITVQAFLHKKGEEIDKEVTKAQIKWQVKNYDQKLLNLPTVVIVGVTDNGLGISLENIKELFNKFKQFHDSKSKIENRGTGLGLVIAKGIVEAHNGIIGVASSEGEGSTFYFTLNV